MFGIGFTEIIVILIVALIIIGPSKLPEFARAVGKGMRQFQDSFNSVKQDLNREMNDVKDFDTKETFADLAALTQEPKKTCPANPKEDKKEC